jgi:hypothetical protein
MATVSQNVAVDATRLRTGRRRTTLAEDARTLRNEQFVDVALGVVRERFTEASHGGALLSELLGPPDVLADKIAAVVPESWAWTSTIGPVYRQASLATARGHSRQAVADLIKKRRVLALTTSDGHVVIPAFQLDSNLQPIRGLPEVLRILTSDVVDDWMLASWLTAPHHSLGGHSVVEHLAAGGDRSKAMSVAEAARQRWSA